MDRKMVWIWSLMICWFMLSLGGFAYLHVFMSVFNIFMYGLWGGMAIFGLIGALYPKENTEEDLVLIECSKCHKMVSHLTVGEDGNSLCETCLYWDTGVLVATHDDKTYVASQSLQDKMAEFDKSLSTIRKALKYTRWIIWIGVAVVLLSISALILIKWETFWFIFWRLWPYG